MIRLNDVEILPTIFPDRTSQIWKLPEYLLDTVYKEYTCVVTWDFEHEDELLHVAQLKVLLDTYVPTVTLVIKYLPYARQDKRVENESTFALSAFAVLLNSLHFAEVKVLDSHNNTRAHAIENLVDLSPAQYIKEAYEQTKSNLILFPDTGATLRYSNYHIGPYITAEKIRDQETGKITSFTMNGKVKGKTVLIVDDIADGGATFCLAAESLKKAGAKKVHLYVTHGIFSKGKEVLRAFGIDKIWTHKGETK